MSTKYSQVEQNLLQNIGEILRSHRQLRNWSQEKVAERAEMNVTYLSDVERGKRNISLINLARLAQAFDLSLEDIFKPSQANDAEE